MVVPDVVVLQTVDLSKPAHVRAHLVAAWDLEQDLTCARAVKLEVLDQAIGWSG